MPTCANCARGLEPAWKYCISCGARTNVPLAPAVPPVADPVVAIDPAADA